MKLRRAPPRGRRVRFDRGPDYRLSTARYDPPQLSPKPGMRFYCDAETDSLTVLPWIWVATALAGATRPPPTARPRHQARHPRASMTPVYWRRPTAARHPASTVSACRPPPETRRPRFPGPAAAFQAGNCQSVNFTAWQATPCTPTPALIAAFRGKHTGRLDDDGLRCP